MTFATPLFLLAGLAAAIPLVLHMIHRQKAKELPFATLRFLKISVQKTRRRKNIHDLLLMLLRMAVLLLIAAGLARPTMVAFHSLWGAASSAVVVILDNSASMGMIDQDRPRFDTATAAVAQILDQLAEGDEVGLLVTGGPALPGLATLEHARENVREVLGQCRVGYQRADLTAKLRQAREMLAKSTAHNKEIFVVTDMQKLSWEGGRGRATNSPLPRGEGLGVRAGGGANPAGTAASPHPNPLPTGEGTGSDSPRPRGEGLGVRAGGGANPAGTAASPHPNPLPEGEGTDHRPGHLPKEEGTNIPVIIVDCNRTPKPNVAVQGVDVEAAVPIAGMPVKATVTLLNTSTVAQQPLVELVIDGAREATSPVLSIPPEGQIKYDFSFTFTQGGLHRGEVHLVGSDGSKYDDRRFFTMEVDPGVPVAVVKNKQHEIACLGDSYYLDQALSLGGSEHSAFRATSLKPDDLLSEPLEKYKVIFCVNLPALGADAVERLQTYVVRGGNVVWICGDNVEPEAYNQMNERARGQLLPATLSDVRSAGAQEKRDSWHINFLDKKYPVLARLVEPASLYESVLVYKHVRMSPAEGQAWILARLDDGEPLLVQRNVVKGKTLMLGTGVQTAWSNLPLRPIFLPLVARLVFHLADIDQTRRSAIAGRPLVLEFPGETRPIGVELITPGGETFRLKTEAVKGQPGQVFRYADTHEIGNYLVRSLDAARPTQIAYSVNFDSDEADPAKLERKDLQEQLAPTPILFADSPDDLSSTFATLREGRSLWSIFLTAVLIALVGETLLSNQFSPKREEQEGPQLSPGMRYLAKSGR